MRAEADRTLSIGVVIDTHPQQRNVIEFERRVLDSLKSVLAPVAAEGFVVSYSDHVRPIGIGVWAPVESELKDAALSLAVDGDAGNTRGAVLNDGVLDGLAKLGSLPEGSRKSLIVIGEGNDGGSTATFSQVMDAAKAKHIQCFALLVAEHRSQVGRVRQSGFDLFRLASGTRGRAYDVRTNPKSLDEALQDVLKRLTTPIR